MNVLQPEKNSERTLIDQLLEEQGALTAVRKFLQRHENHDLPRQAKFYRDLIPLSLPKKGEQYAFEVDLDKCSGCKSCVTACHNLNGLDENETWRSVGLLVGVQASACSASGFAPDKLKPGLQHVTTACHHCIDPACLHGCPVLAYEKDSVTGIVHHLDDQCIGCSYCVMKCPYEVPQFHRKKGIVRKCDMCSSRLLANEAPACVQACPSGAIHITHVSKSETVTATMPGAQLVPNAPGSDYTIPTTRYRSAHGFPADAQLTDLKQIKPAPSHPPLVLMLVLTQLSAGMFCADLFFSSTVNDFRKISSLIATLFGFLGLAASVLHLGRPLQAWRSFLGWRKSWLSREIIFFGFFISLAVWQTASLWLASSVPGIGFASALAISGLLAVFCSAMVYVDTRRVCWNLQRTGEKFFGSTILLGLAANVALEFSFKNAAPVFLVLLVFVSAAKLAWEASFLREAGRARHPVRVTSDFKADRSHRVTRPASGISELQQSALLQLGTLRRVTVARFICGAMGGIILPAALLLSSRVNSTIVCVIASACFALCLLGELLERHLFFTSVVAPKMPGAISA